jgi:hypothetical protein
MCIRDLAPRGMFFILNFLANFVNTALTFATENYIRIISAFTFSAFLLLYSTTMSGKKHKKEERPIFDSIRKPTAPPSRKFGEEKPEEKVHPVQRKTKHKKKIDPGSINGDI